MPKRKQPPRRAKGSVEEDIDEAPLPDAVSDGPVLDHDSVAPALPSPRPVSLRASVPDSNPQVTTPTRRRYDPSADSSSLEFLPDELILYMAQFLETKDLFILSQVSQRLRELVADDVLWKPRCRQLASPPDVETYSARTWRNFCFKALFQTYYDVPHQASVMKDRTRGVNCLQVWRGCLYSGSEDKKVRKWQFKEGTTELHCVGKFVGHKGGVNTLEVWEDYLVSGAFDSSLRLWTEDGECVHKLTGHGFSVYAAKVWNGLLYSGGGDSMRCWYRDPATSVISNTVVYPHTTSCIDVWQFYGLLVCGSFDGRVTFFNSKHEIIRMHQQLHLYTHRPVGVTSIRCWGSRCCSSGSWGVWEWQLGAPGACLIFKLDFTDSLYVWQGRMYSGYDAGFRVWGRTSTGTQMIDQVRGHQAVVKRITAFEGSLFTGSRDGSIRRWTKELDANA
eukprot:TRINITY_DN3739_c0_g1_i3.p1 TRINITY_DN3739_c0_g1~~TRINITY_DN3739_c0_g1_i3.p1  ORF type:complete len:448 (+),score=129.48 TRINITY_DN3739_c0_g1_i3:116-1459(+)